MTTPFAHDELAVKQSFLNLARKYKEEINGSTEKELAAGLIYMNLADYLAEYLVVGFSAMAKEAMTKYYLGQVGMTPPQTEKLNIGTSMKHLERFDFTSKGDILAELTAINDARKKFAHQIFKTKQSDLKGIDEAVSIIIEHTENLVTLVDNISLGLPPRNLYEQILFNPTAVQDDAIEEDSKNEPNRKQAKKEKK
jgi:hypothetical protein